MLKKYIVISALAACGVASTSADAKSIDMSDPTAVYSSVGGVINADGDVDLSFGAGWGTNLFSIESRQNFDAFNVRYAKMQLWKGLGLYVDATFQIEADTGSTVGIGGIYALPISKVFQFYPILTVGGIELTEGDWSTSATFGVYSRIQLGNGFSIGIDPFYTTAENDFSTTSLDSFLGYQYKTHMLRFGFLGSETNHTSYDSKGYIKYKFGF